MTSLPAAPIVSIVYSTVAGPRSNPSGVSSGDERETLTERTADVWVREWPTSTTFYPSTPRGRSWIGEKFDPATVQTEDGEWCGSSEHAPPIIAAMKATGLEVLRRRWDRLWGPPLATLSGHPRDTNGEHMVNGDSARSRDHRYTD